MFAHSCTVPYIRRIVPSIEPKGQSPKEDNSINLVLLSSLPISAGYEEMMTSLQMPFNKTPELQNGSKPAIIDMTQHVPCKLTN
jgi:hypothetical protein